MYTIGLGDLHIHLDFMEKLLNIIHQIFCSRGRPVEQFYWTSNRYFTGCPVEFLLYFSIKSAILRHLKQTCKILVYDQKAFFHFG